VVGREPEFGATAQTVAANVKRLRVGRELTYTQLSERLAGAGSQLTPVAVRRIEDKKRRVTVDDLMSLAVALDVWPITLLMPASLRADSLVTCTGLDEPIAAERLWDWLEGTAALSGTNDDWVAAMSASYAPWQVQRLHEALHSTMVQDKRRRGRDGDGS
jgi:transcriptional regulator with XRE-family HTH domain